MSHTDTPASPRVSAAYLRLLRDLPGQRWFKSILLVVLTAVYYAVFGIIFPG